MPISRAEAAARAVARFLLLSVLIAGPYLWLQPWGFAAFSRPWTERLVAVVVGLAALVGGVTLLARRFGVVRLATGLLGGFGAVAGATAAVVGNTLPALAAAIGAAVCGHAVVCADRLPGGRRRSLLAASLAGAGLAAAFWACSWAGSPGTRPAGGAPPVAVAQDQPGELQHDGWTVSAWRGELVIGAAGGERLLLGLGWRAAAASASGCWTVFDTRRVEPVGWRTVLRDGRLVTSGRVADVTCSAEARVVSDGLRIHVRTRLGSARRAHLATILELFAPGECRVAGTAWRGGPPAELIGFRGGGLHLLRARAAEKGPFTRLAALPAGDPTLRIGDWTIRVDGWAAQASRRPSPTAGWGVSEGTIERYGDHYYWSLAATSVGRGWHAVTTAAGVYVLDVHIGRRGGPPTGR